MNLRVLHQLKSRKTKEILAVASANVVVGWPADVKIGSAGEVQSTVSDKSSGGKKAGSQSGSEKDALILISSRTLSASLFTSAGEMFSPALVGLSLPTHEIGSYTISSSSGKDDPSCDFQWKLGKEAEGKAYFRATEDTKKLTFGGKGIASVEIVSVKTQIDKKGKSEDEATKATVKAESTDFSVELEVNCVRGSSPLASASLSKQKLKSQVVIRRKLEVSADLDGSEAALAVPLASSVMVKRLVDPRAPETTARVSNIQGQSFSVEETKSANKGNTTNIQALRTLESRGDAALVLASDSRTFSNSILRLSARQIDHMGVFSAPLTLATASLAGGTSSSGLTQDPTGVKGNSNATGHSGKVNVSASNAVKGLASDDLTTQLKKSSDVKSKSNAWSWVFGSGTAASGKESQGSGLLNLAGLNPSTGVSSTNNQIGIVPVKIPKGATSTVWVELFSDGRKMMFPDSGVSVQAWSTHPSRIQVQPNSIVNDQNSNNNAFDLIGTGMGGCAGIQFEISHLGRDHSKVLYACVILDEILPRPQNHKPLLLLHVGATTSFFVDSEGTRNGLGLPSSGGTITPKSEAQALVQDGKFQILLYTCPDMETQTVLDVEISDAIALTTENTVNGPIEFNRGQPGGENCLVTASVKGKNGSGAVMSSISDALLGKCESSDLLKSFWDFKSFGIRIVTETKGIIFRV